MQLKQENCLKYGWKDLETLRKMQGDSTFFIGDPPSSFEGYFNNFCLTLGTSVTNWAPNKRDKKVKVNKENKPLMKFMGMTSTLASNRIGPVANDRQPVSTDVVEGWIQKSNKIQNNAKNKNIQSLAAKEHKTRQPLIHKLAAIVAAEIPDLEFDYFAIHNLCRELLLRLQTAEEKVTGPGFTKSYMSQGEHNVAMGVGFVFSTLAGKRDIDTTTVSSTRLLEIAAETFQQWLAEGKGSLVTGADDVPEGPSGHPHKSSSSVSSASSSSSWHTEASDAGVWSMD